MRCFCLWKKHKGKQCSYLLCIRVCFVYTIYISLTNSLVLWFHSNSLSCCCCCCCCCLLYICRYICRCFCCFVAAVLSLDKDRPQSTLFMCITAIDHHNYVLFSFYRFVASIIPCEHDIDPEAKKTETTVTITTEESVNHNPPSLQSILLQ